MNVSINIAGYSIFKSFTHFLLRTSLFIYLAVFHVASVAINCYFNVARSLTVHIRSESVTALSHHDKTWLNLAGSDTLSCLANIIYLTYYFIKTLRRTIMMQICSLTYS